jgi:hypothetical protein
MAPPPPGALSELFGGHMPQDADEQPQPHDGGLHALQEVLDEFPALLTALHDPGDVHDATTALRLLTGIQKRMMGQTGGPPAPPAR